MGAPLILNFPWESVSPSNTLSKIGRDIRAEEYIYQPRRVQARQAAFYRNLVRMAEQTKSRTLSIEVITLEGEHKRLDAGCVKLAEHAGFILTLVNGPSGKVEGNELAWNPGS